MTEASTSHVVNPDAVTSISDVQPRQVVAVAGRVTAVTVSSATEPPECVATVRDDTGTVEAVFLGRREVPGIAAGARIRLRGRCDDSAIPRVFNPLYEHEAAS